MRKRKSAKSTNTATSRGESFKIKSQAAVNRILAKQQSAKSMQLHVSGGASDELRESRHAREAEFLKRVRKAAKEERANRLRWSVLLLYMYMYVYMYIHVHTCTCS